MKKATNTIIKYLVYIVIYIDRFIVAFAPKLSINRIDLQYLDTKNKKNSITRVIMLTLITSMILWPYWGAFVGLVSFIYILYWVVKNYIDRTKRDII